ncbi:MAG TPA: histidinol-phosphate transaminase [Clostridiales bacterium]|nr:histidinol-phosphate transaminase [Clostridiales bacterium]
MTEESSARRFWGRKTRELIPYVPGEQPRERTFIKLNTNENPYSPASAVDQALRSYPPERIRLYPDPASTQLRNVLAEYYGWPASGIFVGNGSDEVLALAFQAFFNSRADLGRAGAALQDFLPGECLVFPDITYSFYPVYARMYEIPFRTVPLREDFSLPIEDLLQPSAGLILANPNAPTGIAVGTDVLAALAAADPDRLLIIDEAYVDFGAESAVSLLDRFDNLLIVQTCSKSRSLAGLRVGCALGAPALIEGLERVRDSFNSYTVDSLAQVAAAAAFSDAGWYERTRARIIATRERTAAALRTLGFQILPSSANFLFVSCPRRPARQLYQELRREGILVRHFNLPRIDNYLRITIGKDEDMDQLTETLRQLLPPDET